METLDRIDYFLRRYEEFVAEHAQDRISEFIRSFNCLKHGFSTIERLLREINKREAKAFNVFQLIRNVERDEVHIHSAIISNLLNPLGSHGQGDLFLRIFLNLNQVDIPVDSMENALWIVEQEKNTPYGRLDIVVRSPGLRFILVIENKTKRDAAEQDGQLERYARWLQSESGAYSITKLIYLTPTGKHSQTAGLNSYKCISYHTDITDWIKRALGGVKAPRVREVLNQYIDVIEKL